MDKSALEFPKPKTPILELPKILERKMPLSSKTVNVENILKVPNSTKTTGLMKKTAESSLIDGFTSSVKPFNSNKSIQQMAIKDNNEEGASRAGVTAGAFTKGMIEGTAIPAGILGGASLVAKAKGSSLGAKGLKGMAKAQINALNPKSISEALRNTKKFKESGILGKITHSPKALTGALTLGALGSGVINGTIKAIGANKGYSEAKSVKKMIDEDNGKEAYEEMSNQEKIAFYKEEILKEANWATTALKGIGELAEKKTLKTLGTGALIGAGASTMTVGNPLEGAFKGAVGGLALRGGARALKDSEGAMNFLRNNQVAKTVAKNSEGGVSKVMKGISERLSRFNPDKVVNTENYTKNLMNTEQRAARKAEIKANIASEKRIADSGIKSDKLNQMNNLSKVDTSNLDTANMKSLRRKQKQLMNDSNFMKTDMMKSPMNAQDITKINGKAVAGSQQMLDLSERIRNNTGYKGNEPLTAFAYSENNEIEKLGGIEMNKIEKIAKINALTGAGVGAATGGLMGATSGDGSSTVRNSVLGAGVGAAAGHFADNATKNALKTGLKKGRAQGFVAGTATGVAGSKGVDYWKSNGGDLGKMKNDIVNKAKDLAGKANLDNISNKAVGAKDKAIDLGQKAMSKGKNLMDKAKGAIGEETINTIKNSILSRIK